MMNRKQTPFLGVVGVIFALSGCRTPGERAAFERDSVKFREVMNQPNHGNEDLKALMEESCESACVECARALFDAGASAPSWCLQKVALKGSAKFARLLIEHGADPDEEIADIQRQSSGIVTVYPQDQAQLAIDLIRRVVNEHGQKQVSSAPAETPSTGSGSLLTATFHEPEHANDYALIVGVEKYEDLPAATYAEADAAVAADFVRAMGVPARNVVTLTGVHATRSGMVKQLENWLAKNTDETSTVYFYFSGHGAPDPATGQAYLVPFDGDPQYLAETAYPLKRLYEKLGALKSKRAIVMIDSCFSGAGGRSVLAKGARPLVNNVDTGLSAGYGKIAVLTASGANQISGTSDEKGHGLFTYYLFNGLNGAAKDASGRVTLQSLYDYLKPRVMDDARRANGDQTPELKVDPAAFTTVLREK